MFLSFAIIAWRNLIRQKMYSFIKLGGFAVGIAACLLITFYIAQELNYDRYRDGDRIFRVLRIAKFRGEYGTGVHFPLPFAAAIRDAFPEFEKVGAYSMTDFFGAGENEVRPIDQAESVHEGGFVFMDQGLVDILEIRFLQGNPRLALTDPYTMVITESKAKEFFPGESPLGKVFILNNDEHRQYKVTGVVADAPVSSHIPYDFILTLAGAEFYEGERSNWENSNYPTYVKLKEGVDPRVVEQKLHSIVTTYMLPAAMKDPSNTDAIEWTKSMSFSLQPVSEIYLNQAHIEEGLPHGDVRYILLFGAISFFILAIACVNFINLSTARSANRAREVGLRKVVGSQRRTLIAQFLTESILYSILSFVIGSGLAWLLLPSFSTLVAKPVVVPLNLPWLVPGVCGAALLTGVVAGIYPALYLSGFRPAQVLKGHLTQGAKNARLRSTLVVFQFTVSIVLVAATLIIHKQMNYILARNVGYDKDHLLILQGTHTLGNKANELKTQLTRLPKVASVTVSGYLPVTGAKRNGNAFYKDGRKGIDPPVGGQRWDVDFDYIQTIGLHLIDGRVFDPAVHSDSDAAVISLTMAKALQLETPIGTTITNGWGKWTIIGVIDDFQFESAREFIGPLMLNIRPSNQAIVIRSATNDWPELINSVTNVWKDFSPHQAIRYSFADENYALAYSDVRRTGRIFITFASLAIVIACLGLFALASFMAEQRAKEISIRIVLGASAGNILQLLSLNFVGLVVLSWVLATPLTIYLMREWLSEFAYRTELNWTVFVAAGLLSIAIAVMTIGKQTLDAARKNPARALNT